MVATVNPNASSRRRGRPYRFPEDSSPLSRVHGGVDQRVAWLLSASRIHAHDPGMAHRDQFVEQLKARGVAADQARVSRWESGAQRVPDRIVTAYEQVLGLAEHHLSAPIHGVRRSLDPDHEHIEPVSADALTIHEDLDRLFEAVEPEEERAESHGSDWLALTSYLATHPQIYLRDKSWTQLAESLISQMGRAVGTAYIRRFEALRTLVRHPGAQRHVVKTIGAFVTDPAAQVVMHPLTLLQEVEHPRAGELAIRMLATGSGMLQQGAAWTTAAKAARGHFDAEALTQLEGLVLMLLATHSRSLPEVDLLDVVARLPEPATRRVLTALKDSPAGPRLELLLRTGEVLPPDVTRHVARQVADQAQTATPAPYHVEPDLMLERLLREALFHGHQERRHQAAVLLSVSPYRPGLSKALARVVEHSDRAVAKRAAMLMRHLCTESERDHLLTWARDHHQPEVRGAAILSLGRLEEGLDHEEEQVVLASLDGATPPLRRACIYALGMTASPALSRLADAEDDDLARRAAAWWRRTGPAIHEPSTIGGQS